MRRHARLPISGLLLAVVLLLAACDAENGDADGQADDDVTADEDDVDAEEEPDDQAAEDEDVETDRDTLPGLGADLFTDDLHDLAELGEPEPGTLELHVDGETFVFDDQRGCDVEEPGPDQDHPRFEGDFLGEDGDIGITVRRLITDESDFFSQEDSVETRFGSGDDQTGSQTIFYQQDGGDGSFQAGDGEVPILRVNEDLEATATGTLEGYLGDPPAGDFELALNCE